MVTSLYFAKHGFEHSTKYIKFFNVLDYTSIQNISAYSKILVAHLENKNKNKTLSCLCFYKA